MLASNTAWPPPVPHHGMPRHGSLTSSNSTLLYDNPSEGLIVTFDPSTHKIEVRRQEEDVLLMCPYCGQRVASSSPSAPSGAPTPSASSAPFGAGTTTAAFGSGLGPRSGPSSSYESAGGGHHHPSSDQHLHVENLSDRRGGLLAGVHQQALRRGSTPNAGGGSRHHQQRSVVHAARNRANSTMIPAAGTFRGHLGQSYFEVLAAVYEMAARAAQASRETSVVADPDISLDSPVETVVDEGSFVLEEACPEVPSQSPTAVGSSTSTSGAAGEGAPSPTKKQNQDVLQGSTTSEEPQANETSEEIGGTDVLPGGTQSASAGDVVDYKTSGAVPFRPRQSTVPPEAVRHLSGGRMFIVDSKIHYSGRGNTETGMRKSWSFEDLETFSAGAAPGTAKRSAAKSSLTGDGAGAAPPIDGARHQHGVELFPASNTDPQNNESTAGVPTDPSNGAPENDPPPEQNSTHLPCGILNDGYYERFFDEVSCLGSGSFGYCFRARHEIDGEYLGEFAVKKVAVGDSRSWLRRVIREVKFFERFGHPNIVAYKHSWLEMWSPDLLFSPRVPFLFILMQYCNGGNLQQLVDRSGGLRSGGMQEQVLWLLVRDVLTGLRYLHSQGMLHRDLKCENVLLHFEEAVAGGGATSKSRIGGGKSWTFPRALLTDFGTVELKGERDNGTKAGTTAPTATTGEDHEDHHLRRDGWTGTIEYTAPELLQQDTKTGELSDFYDERSDMWAVGILVYNLVFGVLPFTGAGAWEIRKKIVSSVSIPFPGDLVDPSITRPGGPKEKKSEVLVDLPNDPQTPAPSNNEISTRHFSAELIASPATGPPSRKFEADVLQPAPVAPPPPPAAPPMDKEQAKARFRQRGATKSADNLDQDPNFIVPPLLRGLLTALLARHPPNRPMAADILENPVFVAMANARLSQSASKCKSLALGNVA